jgi:hypothetical protein
VTSIGGVNGALSLDGILSVSGATITTNQRLAKAGNYTATSSDCGKTFALGGNGLFTLTINAVGTAPNNYSVDPGQTGLSDRSE